MINKRPTKKDLDDVIKTLEECPDFDCRERVMEDILQGKVKMRNRWVVLTEYFGLRTSWIVLVLLLLLGVNSTLYIISKSPEWEFLEFGPAGWTLFIKHIPYGMITAMAALLLVIIFVMRSFSWSYLLPFKIFTVLVVGLTFIGGAIAFATGVNEKLYAKLVEEGGDNDSFLAQFFCKSTNQPFHDRHALLGEVMYADHQRLVVHTPAMEVVTVVNTDGKDWLKEYGIKRFTFVKMIGERQGDQFLAAVVKQEPQKQNPLQRTEEDCMNKEQWRKKREVLEKRRRAATQPLTPAVGTAQFIKNIY